MIVRSKLRLKGGIKMEPRLEELIEEVGVTKM